MARKRAGAGLNPADIAGSGLFDAAWYVRANAKSIDGTDPLTHYARHGHREDRAPNAYFDVAAYRERACLRPRTDVVRHYLHYGEPKGLSPGPHFDPAWYRETYRVDPAANALAHFLAARSGRDKLPNLTFYAASRSPRYRTLPPETDMFETIAADRKRGRKTNPDIAVIRESGLFDDNHYLVNGSDVHEAEIDPVAHFCVYGWREGRRPNLYFDTAWYRRVNPEVARVGFNPLAHYILEGEHAGRRPVVYFDPVWYRRAYDVPEGELALAHFLRHRRTQRHSPNPHFDVEWYVARHRDRLGGNRDPFAHFLHVGTYADVDPSPRFQSAAHRRASSGRITRHFTARLLPDTDNVLVRYLHATY